MTAFIVNISVVFLFILNFISQPVPVHVIHQEQRGIPIDQRQHIVPIGKETTFNSVTLGGQSNIYSSNSPKLHFTKEQRNLNGCDQSTYQIVTMPVNNPQNIQESIPTYTGATENGISRPNVWSDQLGMGPLYTNTCIHPKSIGFSIIQSCQDIYKIGKLKIFSLQIDIRFDQCQLMQDYTCTANDDLDDELGICPNYVFRHGILKLNTNPKFPVLCCRAICPGKMNQFLNLFNPKSNYRMDINHSSLYHSMPIKLDYRNQGLMLGTNQLTNLDDALQCAHPKDIFGTKIKSCHDLRLFTILNGDQILTSPNINKCSWQNDLNCSYTETNQFSQIPYSTDLCLVAYVGVCQGISVITDSTISIAHVYNICKYLHPDLLLLNHNILSSIPVPKPICCRIDCLRDNEYIYDFPSRSAWISQPKQDSNKNIMQYLDSLKYGTPIKPVFGSPVGAGTYLRPNSQSAKTAKVANPDNILPPMNSSAQNADPTQQFKLPDSNLDMPQDSI